MMREASTAERSISFLTMTALARRRQLSRRANSLKATRFLIFQSLVTPTNNAIQKYLNERKVPQLFVATGATKFGDPKNFPWTMGWQPSYQSEGRAYATHLLANKPDAKIAIMYQNDDFGKNLLKGLKDGLGAKTSMIVA